MESGEGVQELTTKTAATAATDLDLDRKAARKRTFLGGTMATADLGAMDMWGLLSFSPLMDLRRALSTRMAVSLSFLTEFALLAWLRRYLGGAPPDLPQTARRRAM